MRKPKVGDIVLYQKHDIFHEMRHFSFPAIVVFIEPDEMLTLAVLTGALNPPISTQFYVHFDDSKAPSPNTWHWPPEQP